MKTATKQTAFATVTPNTLSDGSTAYNVVVVCGDSTLIECVDKGRAQEIADALNGGMTNLVNPYSADLAGVRAELKTVRDGFASEFANNCKLQHDFEEMRLRARRAEATLAKATPPVDQ